jgi:Zn finger protein HypA/HybF involved in hydrogenase expression
MYAQHGTQTRNDLHKHSYHGQHAQDTRRHQLTSTALTCRQCGHSWQSKASAGNTIRCPECGKAKYVPRARTRVNEKSTANAWTQTEIIPDRDKAERDCPECGEPLYWSANRAFQSCDNAHWYLPPDTVARSQSLIKHRATVAEHVIEPTVIEIAQLDIERDAFMQQCNNALAKHDTQYLRNADTSEFWNESIAAGYRSLFASLARQASNASHDKLEELRAAYNNAYHAPQCQQNQAQIQQALKDEANRLAYLSNWQRQFKVARNTNRVIETTINNSGSPAHGEIIEPRQAIRPTTTRLALPARPARSDYDADDMEDDEDIEDADAEDYEYDYYSRSDRKSSGAPIGTIFLAVLAIYVAIRITDAYKHRGIHKCAYAAENHKFRTPIATHGWQSDGPVYTCSARSCHERAKDEYSISMNGHIYSPDCWALTDANGFTPDNPNYIGHAKC